MAKVEQASRPFHEPATGSAPSRAASRSALAVSAEVEPAIGCEPFLFWVGQVRPFGVGEIWSKFIDLSLAISRFNVESHAPVATAGTNIARRRYASRSYPRLPVTVRRMNSPTGAGSDKTTRASTSGASPSLRAIWGWSTSSFSSLPIFLRARFRAQWIAAAPSPSDNANSLSLRESAPAFSQRANLLPVSI